MEITFYGFTYALGIITYFFILRNYFKLKYKNPDLILSYSIYVILGMIIGARLVYVFYYLPNYYINHLNEVFYLWQGGMSLHGGLIGIILVSYIYTKKNKLDFLELADIMIIPAPIVIAITRVANFYNSELYGTVTNLPWCINFKNVRGCRHPSQLYELVLNFSIFWVLLYFHITKRLKKGTLFFLYMLLYSFFRFFLDFYKVYDNYYFGLATGQYLDIITIIISIYFIIMISKK